MLRKYIYSEKTDNIYFDATKKPNAKRAIIFLHGLCSSRRSWGKDYRVLSKYGSLYFVDLLGFGFSAKPDTNYTLEKHISALREFVEKEVKEKEIIFVGHSLGSIIALGYTSLYPGQVKKAILTALPYYFSSEEAKSYAKNASRLKFIFSYNLRTKVLCTLMCSVFGSITRLISPYLIIKDLPKELAHDGFRHSYQSYISTLTNVIYNQNLTKLLSPSLLKKISLIHGTRDKIVPLKNVEKLAKKYDIPLTILENSAHRFPIFDSQPVVEELERVVNF